MEVELSAENFSKISEFIYRKSGIALTSDKHYEKVQKKINSRCETLGIDDFRKYFFTLRFEDTSGQEFQELINALTVNETYFFREKHQFEILLKYVLPQLDAKKSAKEPIRILCAPCSTGEEPYTVAIHLLEQNDIVNRRDIEIVGIDIDTTVIEKAKKGLYTDRSLHAMPPYIISKYFKKIGALNELSGDIRSAIHLRVANVFDKEQMRSLGRFDVIFSRNMLIYFDDASRKEVAMTFYGMLNDGGYIFLGHAEYMSRIVSVFKVEKFENHLVYQK